MKYVDYKNELQKPENKSILARVKADFTSFLLNESDHPSYANLVEFCDHQFMFRMKLEANNQFVGDQVVYSIWHTWLACNGFKYLGLQHQEMYHGFAVYCDWNHGTFFADDGDMYQIPIPQKTLIDDCKFMEGVLKKAKAAYPELNWRVIDVQIEWRKA